MAEKRLADTLEKDGTGHTIRPVIEGKTDENGKIVITQEMREMADALAHPQGDPYLNGRDLGFYCEQCG